MNESEKRRQRLLQETRQLYSDKGMIPAVHPRYGAVYHKLYEKDEAAVPGSTFGIRLLLCCFLFVLFLTADRQDQKILDVSSDQILEYVTQDTDVAEVWKNL